MRCGIGTCGHLRKNRIQTIECGNDGIQYPAIHRTKLLIETFHHLPLPLVAELTETLLKGGTRGLDFRAHLTLPRFQLFTKLDPTRFGGSAQFLYALTQLHTNALPRLLLFLPIFLNLLPHLLPCILNLLANFLLYFANTLPKRIADLTTPILKRSF